MKIFAKVINLVLWLGLLVVFIFSDQIGIKYIPELRGGFILGPYHIFAILFATVGVSISIFLFWGNNNK